MPRLPTYQGQSQFTQGSTKEKATYASRCILEPPFPAIMVYVGWPQTINKDFFVYCLLAEETLEKAGIIHRD